MCLIVLTMVFSDGKKLKAYEIWHQEKKNMTWDRFCLCYAKQQRAGARIRR